MDSIAWNAGNAGSAGNSGGRAIGLGGEEKERRVKRRKKGGLVYLHITLQVACPSMYSATAYLSPQILHLYTYIHI